MPHRSLTVSPPTITALTSPGITRHLLSTHGLVAIESVSSDCRLFFTTDGTEPDVTKPHSTHRYKNPFRLKPGRRTVQAVAFSRSTGEKSVPSVRTFKVVDENESIPDTEDTVSDVVEDTIPYGTQDVYRGTGISDEFSQLGSRELDMYQRDPTVDDYFESSLLSNRGTYHGNGMTYRDYDTDGGETCVTNYFRSRSKSPRSRIRPVSPKLYGLEDPHEFDLRAQEPVTSALRRSLSPKSRRALSPGRLHTGSYDYHTNGVYSNGSSGAYSNGVYTNGSRHRPHTKTPYCGPDCTNHIESASHRIHEQQYRSELERERARLSHDPRLEGRHQEDLYRDRYTFDDSSPLSRDYDRLVARRQEAREPRVEIREEDNKEITSEDDLIDQIKLEEERKKKEEEELIKKHKREEERKRLEERAYRKGYNSAAGKLLDRELAELEAENKDIDDSISDFFADNNSRRSESPSIDGGRDKHEGRRSRRDDFDEDQKSEDEEKKDKGTEKEKKKDKKKKKKDRSSSSSSSSSSGSSSVASLNIKAAKLILEEQEKKKKEKEEKKKKKEAEKIKKEKEELEKRQRELEKRQKEEKERIIQEEEEKRKEELYRRRMEQTKKKKLEKERTQREQEEEENRLKEVERRREERARKREYEKRRETKTKQLRPYPLDTPESTPRSSRSTPRSSGRKAGEPRGRMPLQNSTGGLNFVNDSGTQINYWGKAPPASKVLRGAVREKDEDLLSDIFSSRSSHSQDKSHLIKEWKPTKQSSTRSAPPQQPPSSTITRTQQSENQSIGDSIKKFFSGWGSSNKSSHKVDKRKTVNELGQKGDLTYREVLKKCKKKKNLFEDPDFPTNDDSLYYENKPVDGEIEWKRPHELCENPQMFVGSASRFDVKQGVLGNCWLLAAVSSLATEKKLLYNVVPKDQSFDDDYQGVFRFHIWQSGKWLEVVVDDRLPTCNGELIYMHSEDNNEFWSALLEKAYAKLFGCYEVLSGGLTSEAMTDFTGGVAERFNFKEELPSNMFQVILKAIERDSLLGCSIDASADEIENELDNGLIIGHAYSITDCKIVGTDRGEEELLRVRNPWGNECEWKGAWSDSSSEWSSISDSAKRTLGISKKDDGEFWMSFRDFTTYFHRLEICNIIGTEGSSNKQWSCKTIDGSWKNKVNAGGCRNFPKTFFKNPQYRVTVTDVDDDDEEDIGTIIVGLMQVGRRKLRSEGVKNYTIGYEIYSMEGVRMDTLTRKHFDRRGPTDSSPTYIDMREVVGRHRLPPGDYCIVPTTFEPGEEADFILRVFSENECGAVEMDVNTAIVRCAASKPVMSAPSRSQQSEAEKMFEQYDGEDGVIDAFELQEVLNTTFTKDFEFDGFDVNLCRCLVALKDTDQTGKLDKQEFQQLWKDLQQWKTTYLQFDTDKSGHFNSTELRDALRQDGYEVSNATFSGLALRFSDKGGHVRFDDYVACVLKMKTLFAIFKQNQVENEDKCTFQLDEFVQLNMYS